MPNDFIGVRHEWNGIHNLFDFQCACGYEAELGVRQDRKLLVACPECGSLYFMRPAIGMFTKPRLTPVVAA